MGDGRGDLQALLGAHKARESIFTVPYDFADYDDELEPQAAFARGGGPPRKHSSIGVLDPPFPPKRPPGPIPTTPTPLLFRVFAGMLLVGLTAAILFLLFGVH